MQKTPRPIDKTEPVFSTAACLLAVLICSACAGSRYTGDLEEELVESENFFHAPVMITAGNASNFTQDLSPNGKWVLYTSDKTGNQDIWEKEIHGGENRRLTGHSADDLGAVMSPDGNTFAFVSRRQDATGDIHFLGIGDDDEESLSFNLKKTADSNPVWFPDSERIVFSARQPGHKYPRIMIGSTETFKAKELEGVSGYQPWPSPDGQNIAYSRNGSIYIYSMTKRESQRITRGGSLQDSQPVYSHDGSHLYFIRYADDTNNDGQLNADDRPTLWQLRLPRPPADGEVEAVPTDLAPRPLTSSRFSIYYPRERPPWVYFTLQTRDSLDIFRLPHTGHTRFKDESAVTPDHPTEVSDTGDITYLYRLKAHILHKNNRMADLQTLLARQLYWQVRKGRRAESRQTLAIIRDTFPLEKDLNQLADLLMLKLKISPVTYPDYRNELSIPTKQMLLESQARSGSIQQSVAADSPLLTDTKAIGAILQARLLATEKKFFDSLNLLQETSKNLKFSPHIEAEISLMTASLVTEVSDRQTAIARLVEVIRENKDQRPIVVRASQSIMEVIEKAPDTAKEEFATIKSTWKDLPVLPAMAHQKIVERYQKENNDVVAANELREMVVSYPQSPDLTLDAIRQLTGYEEREGRYDAVEKMLRDLLKKFQDEKQEPRIIDAARELLINHLLRRGESLMRAREPAMAIKTYRKVEEIDPLNISAHKGMIDAFFLRKKIGPTQEKYEKLLDAHPDSPYHAYFYGYSLTYNIDLSETPAERLDWIDECIDIIADAGLRAEKSPQIYQTLGWLYHQRSIWQRKYEERGGTWAGLKKNYGTFLSYIGYGDPDWLEMAADSYLVAWYLSPENSLDKANLSQNLGETYFDMKNYNKALRFYIERIRKLDVMPIRSATAEAIVVRKAGRSAFQIGELEVARDLLLRSLRSWESVNNDKEIARTLDYLGLAYQEGREWTKAATLYARLADLNRRMGQPTNQAVSLINQAYATFMQKKYEKALNLYGQAFTILNQEDVELEVEGTKGIEVGIAGQSTEAKGFNKTSRLIQIKSFESDIHLALGRQDQAIEALEAKLAFQTQKREEGIDQGKKEKFYAEELAITHNRLGGMLLTRGRYRESAEHYRRAKELAYLTRPENSVVPVRAEWLNLANMARVQMRRAEQQELPQPEADALAANLEVNIKALRGEEKQPPRAHEAPLSRLISLQHQLNLIRGVTPVIADEAGDGDATENAGDGGATQITGDEVTTEGTGEKLVATDEVGEGMTTDDTGKNQVTDETGQGTREKSNQKKKAEPTKPQTPKGGLMLALHMGAKQNLPGQVLPGILMADQPEKLQEQAHDPALNPNRILRGLAADSPNLEWRYFFLKGMQEEAYRTILRSEKPWNLLRHKADFDIFDQMLGHLLEGVSLPEQRYLMVRRHLLHRTRAAAPDLARGKSGLLQIRKDADITAALGPGEGILTLSAYAPGKPEIFIHSKAGLKSIRTATDADSLLEVLTASGYPENLNHLYITVQDDLWKQAGIGLFSAKGTRSWINSPDDLPWLIRIRTVPKVSVLAMGKETEALRKANSSKEFRASPNGGGDLTGYNIIHVDLLTTLSPYDPASSRIHLKGDKLTSEDWTPRLLSQIKTEATGIIVLGRTRTESAQSAPLYSQGEIYRRLYLAAAAAGIPSLVIRTPGQSQPESEDKKPVDWQPFYDNLGRGSVAQAVGSSKGSMQLFGYGGLRPSAELDWAKMHLPEAMEKKRLREALYYALLLKDDEKIDELLLENRLAAQQKLNFAAALYYQEKILSRVEDPDDLDYADELQTAGGLAVSAGRYKLAHDYLTKSNAMFVEEEEPGQAGKGYKYLALNYEKQKKYHEAIDAFKKSRELYLEDEDAETAAARMLDIGNIYNRFLSDYASALEYYAKASEEFEAEENDEAQRAVAIDQANTLIVIGQVRKAITILEEILEELDDEDEDELPLWIRTGQILSNAYYRAALFQEAIDLNSRVLARVDDLQKPLRKATARINAVNLRAMIDAKIGKEKEAMEGFFASASIAKKFKMQSKLSLLYNNIGFWHREFGNIRPSIRYLRMALAIDEELKSESSIAYDLRNLGLSTMLSGNLNEARDQLTKSLEMSTRLNLSYNAAYCEFGLGDLELRTGNLQGAEGHYLKALDISKKGFLQDFVWRAHAGIALVADKRGDNDTARDHYDKGTRLIESLRAGLKSEASRTGFQSDRGVQEVYRDYVALLMRTGQHLEAWQVSERSRARAFIDSLANQPLEFADPAKNELLEQEKGLRNSRELLERKLNRLPEKHPERPATIAALKESGKAYQDHIAKIRSVDPQLAQLVSVEDISIEELGTLLPKDVALVEYMLANNEIFIWVIHRGKLTGTIVAYDNKLLHNNVDSFRNLLQSYSTTRFLGEELASALIKPIQGQLESVKRLAIVPHGDLHYLSFAALPLDEGYLLDRFSLHYLESATVARFTHRPTKAAPYTSSQTRILALGNPSLGPDLELPFAEKETGTIPRYFQQTHRLVGEDASETNFRKEALAAGKDYRIIHIASHGEFKEKDPASSRLKLTSDESHDGDLSVREVFGMKIGADLVTLSACETGLGKLGSGDEIIGLNRAFFYAGTKSLISTLWRINDVSSAVAVKRFYRYLSEGTPKDLAMRKAQLKVREYYPHPSYWAAFRLLGSYR